MSFSSIDFMQTRHDIGTREAGFITPMGLLEQLCERWADLRPAPDAQPATVGQFCGKLCTRAFDNVGRALDPHYRYPVDQAPDMRRKATADCALVQLLGVLADAGVVDPDAKCSPHAVHILDAPGQLRNDAHTLVVKRDQLAQPPFSDTRHPDYVTYEWYHDPEAQLYVSASQPVGMGVPSHHLTVVEGGLQTPFTGAGRQDPIGLHPFVSLAAVAEADATVLPA